jgi:hypothetical protein
MKVPDFTPQMIIGDGVNIAAMPALGASRWQFLN